MHNVNWDTVCKPKNLGGLGLRSARELNKAFLMKVAWNIISRPVELWVKALSTKYLIRSTRGYMLRSNSGHSTLWRGVLKVWEHTLNGIQFNVNDGKSTRFWTDRWLDSGDLLIDLAYNIQGVDSSLSVSSFVSSDGSCDRLKADSISWGLEPSGRFSVNSAYLFIKDLKAGEQGTIWKKVWRWNGPAKIRQFLWLSVHGKLMTNEERWRRRVTADASCPECKGSCEDTEHVLRRCDFAELVWREMLPDMALSISNGSDFSVWWNRGLSDGEKNLVFGVTAWVLWKRRNQLIFHSENLSVSEVCGQVKFWVHLYSSSWKTLQASRETSGIARQAHLIGWRPAGEGWFSLNSDGSLYTTNNAAAAGGVIRDGNGRFIKLLLLIWAFAPLCVLN
ncbi:Putative ribonuclease H protein At1g65750 [Linum perenne]